MYKILGSMLIVLSTALAGVCMIKSKRENIKKSQMTLCFFKSLKENIISRQNDITLAIEQCLEKKDFPQKPIFSDFIQQARKNNTESFEQCFENCDYKSKYSEIDCEVLKEFSKQLDIGGDNFYTNATDNIIEQLEHKIENDIIKLKTDEKLIMSFFISFGVFLVILLI